MKFVPLGSSLKSTQINPKTASFAKNTKKLWDLRKTYPYIYTRQLFDYSYSTLNVLNSTNLWWCNIAAPQYTV